MVFSPTQKWKICWPSNWIISPYRDENNKMFELPPPRISQVVQVFYRFFSVQSSPLPKHIAKVCFFEKLSGQIIIFHQPPFPWNKGVSHGFPSKQLPFGDFFGRVFGRDLIWPELWRHHQSWWLTSPKLMVDITKVDGWHHQSWWLTSPKLMVDITKVDGSRHRVAQKSDSLKSVIWGVEPKIGVVKF